MKVGVLYVKWKDLSEILFLRNMSEWHRSNDGVQGDKLT